MSGGDSGSSGGGSGFGSIRHNHNTGMLRGHRHVSGAAIDVEVRIASDIPTDLTIDGGAGEFFVDLSGVSSNAIVGRRMHDLRGRSGRIHRPGTI